MEWGQVREKVRAGGRGEEKKGCECHVRTSALKMIEEVLRDS